MTIDDIRFSDWSPRPTRVRVVPDELFLFRVDTDHRILATGELRSELVQIPELGVAVRMPRTLFLLRRGLQ